MKRIFLYLFIIMGVVACQDNDTFTTSTSARLTFSADTLLMDTMFSGVGSMTYSFWVYNNASDGIRLQTVRLKQGNQTGFRVNVDGSYLDNSLGSVAHDLEVRKGDSIRVFVELTAVENLRLEPQLLEDDLLFYLESGVQQIVNLRAYVWDALQLRDVVVSHDSLIESNRPLVIYGGIRVDSLVTLTIRNTTIYFHDKAGIDVHGCLKTDSVLMRGDRLDHMFDYLPYDRVSGQWRGVRFYAGSTGNVLSNTQIRNAEDGIICDSVAYDSLHTRLQMQRCIVHNCKGVGVRAFNSLIEMSGCQITNTLGDCVAVYGGLAVMESCTVAQFYPFDAKRGAALRFCNSFNGHTYPLEGLVCARSIVTGYEDDVVMGEAGDSTAAFDYYFTNTLLRTPEVIDTTRFKQVIWESPKDEIQGKKHFVLIDEKNMVYDFHLDSLSTAKGLGAY